MDYEEVKRKIQHIARMSNRAIDLLPLMNSIDQLESDAELGRAVKEWFKQCHVMEYTGVEVWNEQELLEWYRAQKVVKVDEKKSSV